MGRPATVITLSETENAELLRRIKLPKGAQDACLRAKIILACAAGESGNDIAQRLGTSKGAVSRWRQRFSKLEFLGLNYEPRSGRPRTISDEQVQQVVSQVLQSKPDDSSHWSTRHMSRETCLSPASIMRIWHAFGIKPHLEKTFKLSTDPLFVDKVHDIVGLYLNPPERALMLCVDEKSHIAVRPRYNIHFTPTSASRPNLVECFFVTLSEKWIKRQAHVSVKDLEASIEHYLETYNQNPKPFRCTRKTRKFSPQSLVQHERQAPDFFSGTSETPHWRFRQSGDFPPAQISSYRVTTTLGITIRFPKQCFAKPPPLFLNQL